MKLCGVMNSQKSALRECTFYKQKGTCKFDNSCRYKHTPNILSIPFDIFEIIVKEQYMSDIRQVCRKFREIIDRHYPLRLFSFVGVMNGCYTPGCAIAIARCFNDAVFQISIRALNCNTDPECRYGTWSPYDREFHGTFVIKKWEDMDKEKLSDSDFRIFYRKFCNLLYFPKYKIIKHISHDEMIVKKLPPPRVTKGEKIMAFNIYFELRNKNFSEHALDKSIGFFCGGGS